MTFEELKAIAVEVYDANDGKFPVIVDLKLHPEGLQIVALETRKRAEARSVVTWLELECVHPECIRVTIEETVKLVASGPVPDAGVR